MKYTNIYNLPQSFVDVITNLTWDKSESEPKRLSITNLINPPIQNLLAIRHWKELEEDVSSHIWRITGSAYHYILSKTKEEGRLIEEKLTEVIDDITIVGKLDLYDGLLKSIEDYKVTSIWSIKFNPTSDYEPQLNCYAWLLRKTGFEVDKAFINCILRDWRKGESLQYDDYCPIPFKRLEIKLWSFEEQEKYVKERVKLYKEALELEDNNLPICNPKERWAKEDKWAVYKGKNKRAVRVLNSETEAIEYACNKEVPNYRIELREGIDEKCVNYCNVNKFCKYWKEKYER